MGTKENALANQGVSSRLRLVLAYDDARRRSLALTLVGETNSRDGVILRPIRSSTQGGL